MKSLGSQWRKGARQELRSNRSAGYAETSLRRETEESLGRINDQLILTAEIIKRLFHLTFTISKLARYMLCSFMVGNLSRPVT
jgi:hypothetical protein